jgi:hypothetical protein
MIKSVTIKVNNVDMEAEIPFGYIPIYDGPLCIGDKTYAVIDHVWKEVNFTQCRNDEVRDFYLVIRPMSQ